MPAWCAAEKIRLLPVHSPGIPEAGEGGSATQKNPPWSDWKHIATFKEREQIGKMVLFALINTYHSCIVGMALFTFEGYLNGETMRIYLTNYIRYDIYIYISEKGRICSKYIESGRDSLRPLMLPLDFLVPYSWVKPQWPSPLIAIICWKWLWVNSGQLRNLMVCRVSADRCLTPTKNCSWSKRNRIMTRTLRRMVRPMVNHRILRRNDLDIAGTSRWHHVLTHPDVNAVLLAKNLSDLEQYPPIN